MGDEMKKPRVKRALRQHEVLHVLRRKSSSDGFVANVVEEEGSDTQHLCAPATPREGLAQGGKGRAPQSQGGERDQDEE